MKLPSAFLDKMNKLLGENEFRELMNSYDRPRYYGLRVNTLKISVEDFLKISPFELEPVPWTTDGFYYNGEMNPGRHPYYHAGLYYIQEPSAMLPGQVLEARPGERILDLCAAPGGKTVQVAAAMNGEGLLVSNDISPERVKALVKNIELCAVKNALVLNEKPEKLAETFEGYFDRILADVPCSGEGMFRKDENAAKSWESFKCEKCAAMQLPIIESAHRMLKDGGILVYSTCTFSPEENEMIVGRFLKNHPEYEMIEIEKTAGIQDGRPEWAGDYSDPQLRKAARLWPHRVKGEGHFVAKLKKGKTCNCPAINQGKTGDEAITDAEATLSIEELPSEFMEFIMENLCPDFSDKLFCGRFIKRGNNIYMPGENPPKLKGLRVAKFGWYLGELADRRFEPSHSLAVSLPPEAFRRTLDFSSDSREVYSYLKGETIMTKGEKGYTVVCVDGYTLGWGKHTGDYLKNLYPKGWRKLA